MVETATVFGLIIFAGIMALFWAMPPWLRSFMLRHHFMTSITVTVVTLWLHMGTMTGLMSATVAGLVTSLGCLTGRWYWRIA